MPNKIPKRASMHATKKLILTQVAGYKSRT